MSLDGKINLESKDIIDAIQKASKVDSIEKLLWDIKGSIKHDLVTAIEHSNKLQVAEFRNFVKELIADNNEKNLKPIREDVEQLKGDRKAVKFVASTIAAGIAFLGTCVGLLLK